MSCAAPDRGTSWLLAPRGACSTVAGWVAQVESVFTTPLRVDRANPEAPVFSGTDGFTVTTFPA